MTSYPSRRTTRLSHYDYSQAGAYFVTLCVEGRHSLLGRVIDDRVQLSPAGNMVATVWRNLGHYYPVEVDAYSFLQSSWTRETGPATERPAYVWSNRYEICFM